RTTLLQHSCASGDCGQARWIYRCSGVHFATQFMTDGYELFMSANHTEPGQPPRQKRWIVLLILAVLLLAVLAGLWWWNKSRIDALNRLQQEQLSEAQARQQALAATLASLPSVNPENCPPGQVLRPITNAAATATPTSATPSEPSGTNATALK